MEKAVVLLSGGLDSTTALFSALKAEREVYIVSFQYGQRHAEQEAAAVRRIIESVPKSRLLGYNVVFLRHITSVHWTPQSSLVNDRVALPSNRKAEEMGQGIPSTFVPGRNSLFLSIAAGFADELGADEVWTGFNEVDYSGYPDCREAYVEAMEKALALGLRRGTLAIRAPLIHMKKREIVLLGLAVGAPLQHTWSCYAGGVRPCGKCDSCIIRADGFKEAGVSDPAVNPLCTPSLGLRRRSTR